MNVFNTYVSVAGIGAGVSALIVVIALNTLRTISDGGMFAIALMAMAPSLMAVGVAFFVHRTHIALIHAGRDPREFMGQRPPVLPLSPPPPTYPEGGFRSPSRDH